MVYNYKVCSVFIISVHALKRLVSISYLCKSSKRSGQYLSYLYMLQNVCSVFLTSVHGPQDLVVWYCSITSADSHYESDPPLSDKRTGLYRLLCYIWECGLQMMKIITVSCLLPIKNFGLCDDESKEIRKNSEINKNWNYLFDDLVEMCIWFLEKWALWFPNVLHLTLQGAKHLRIN